MHTDAGLEVEVKDPPKGMIPPGTQMVKPKAEPQPSKVSFLVNKVKSAPSNFYLIVCWLNVGLGLYTDNLQNQAQWGLHTMQNKTWSL